MARELVVADPAKRVSARRGRATSRSGSSPSSSSTSSCSTGPIGITDLDARGALVSINVERTIEGGSTVTMKLADPKRASVRSRVARRIGARGKGAAARAAARHPVEVDEGWEPMLAPDTIGRAMEVELDGVVFRLVKVRYSSATQQAELTFEDRIVYWLKRKRASVARRAARARAPSSCSRCCARCERATTASSAPSSTPSADRRELAHRHATSTSAARRRHACELELELEQRS
jgi:hypothetical protein